MSFPTKLFVVLLVFMSLMTTAATVVYVNKEDLQRRERDALQDEVAGMRAQSQALRQTVATREQEAEAARQQLEAQRQSENKALAEAQREALQLRQQLAAADRDKALQQISIAQLTEALGASQTTVVALRTQVEDPQQGLRARNDQLVQQAADLNARVSDLTNRLDVTERERRLLAEQLTQAQGENQRLSQVIRGAGLSPRQEDLAVARSGMPAINGVVRDVRTIAGVPYATISVGSADGVQRGMEFRVVDRASGDFLGTVVVNSVEPNEATGRLAGPNVAAVRPGVEVRTQL